MNKLILISLECLTLLIFSLSVSANTSIDTENLAPPTITCSPFSNLSVDSNCERNPNTANVYNITITDMTDTSVNLTETVTNADGSIFYSEENLPFAASPTGEQTTVRVRELMTPGTFNYTITVENSTGETDECSFTINVADNSQPDVSCETFTAVLDETGMVTVTPEEFAATASVSDNCSDVADLTFQLSQTEFTCDNLGGNDLTFTATDESSNATQCSASIVVVDNTPPTAICQPVTVQLDGDNLGTLAATQIDNGSNDLICGGAVDLKVSLDGTEANAASLVPVDCDAVNGLTATLFVTDESDNTSSCTSEILIETNATLNAQCRDVIVQLDEDGNGSIQPADIDNGSAGACNFNLSLDNDSFDCSNVGANIVELTASDVTGSESCTAVVLVEDNIAPANFCFEGISVELIENTVTVAATEFNNGSTDACGIDNILVGTDNDIANASPSITLSCDALDIVDNTVTVFLTDVNGNVSTCNFISIDIEDNTAPTIACPEDITVAANDNFCFFSGLDAEVTVDDNCSIFRSTFSLDFINSTVLDTFGTSGTTFQGDFPEGLLSFFTFGEGETSLNFSTEDQSGNTASCSFSLTVEDQTPPNAVCESGVFALNESGLIDLADISALADQSTDNCTANADLGISFLLTNSADCDALGESTVIFNVTDESGNLSSCESMITISDNLPPLAACQDITINLNAEGVASLNPSDIDGGSSDNCTAPTDLIFAPENGQTQFDCADVGTFEMDFSVTDESDNATSCAVQITVADGTEPLALCQDVTVEIATDGSPGILTAAAVDNGSSDACGIESLQISLIGQIANAGSDIALDCEDIDADLTVTLFVTDANSNTENCTAAVTVVDSAAPVLNCSPVSPIAVNDNCVVPNASENVFSLTATDNCSFATITKVYTDADENELLSITLPFAESASVLNDLDLAPGITTLTVTVTDDAGNVGNCSVDITVIDDTAPIVSTTETVIQLDETGNAVVNAAFFDNGTTDNCDFELAIDATTFDCTDVGGVQVNFTATDEFGNQSSTSLFVTVEDNIAPSINCPSDQVVAANTQCLFTGLSAQPTFSDNCEVVSLTCLQGELGNQTMDGVLSPGLPTLEGLSFELGTTILTLIAADAAENEAQCSFTVTVEDQTAPTALCADLTVQTNEDGFATASAQMVNASSNDNCTADENLVFTLSQSTFGCTETDANDVTLFVIDEAGNEATCAAVITVVDNTPPTAICQDFTVQLDENGEGLINPTDADGGSTDNCTAPTDLIFATATGVTTLTCADLEGINVDITVTDEAGNSSICSVNITAEDNIPPTAICQNLTLFADASGTATANPADVNNGSTDNCTITTDLTFALDQTSFDCTISVNTGLTLTVTDAFDNTSTCTATVSLEDNIAPDIICQTVTAQLDETGIATINPADADNGSTDNCTPAEELSFDIIGSDEFTCDNLGSNSVTFTATDASSNISQCSGTVIIEDNIAPVLSNCTGSVQSANINCEFIGSAANFTLFDNCDNLTFSEEYFDENGNNFLNDISSLSSGTFSISAERVFPLGVNTIILTASDASGNTSSCSLAVEVVDTTAPSALCQDVSVTLDEAGSASVLVSDINNGSTDNCTSTENLIFTLVGNTQFSCNGAGENSVNMQVIDEAGNIGSCTAVVTVIDNTPAVIECRQPVSTTTSPGTCGAEDLTILEPFALFDNCGAGNVTFTRIPAGNDFPVGETVLNWTATDANGNTSTCQSLVIITDNEFPVISSSNTAVGFINPGSCTADVQVTAEVSDNCGIANVEGLGFFNLPSGVHENPITVTDVNGNVTVHNFTIFVHDNLAPQFQNCPADTLILEVGADGTAAYPEPTPVATDNCGTPIITNDLPETGYPIGYHSALFTATDDYGNTSECLVNIFVNGGIQQHPVANIGSSLEENEQTQTVSWNALNAGTGCELCAETQLEGFKYIGTWWGHQYFLANEISLTRTEAAIIAEEYNAHLAVINDAAENNYLTEALADEVRSAWIGLMPQLVDEEWTFAWDNGNEFDFDLTDIEEVSMDTRIILNDEGTWSEATNEEAKYFLIERPCVNFIQTGPIYTTPQDSSVLLRSGDAFPEGVYEVTYALTDMCGNESEMSFDINVLPGTTEYCTTSGIDHSVWVESIIFHDLISESGDSLGYADFTENPTTMNIGDGTILLNLQAGGNEDRDMLYWNVYLDANSDGDFFDSGELLYEVADTGTVTTNLTLPITSVENARLRVMVSRYAFAAPCGDTYVGEIEDYTINLLTPTDYSREACEVQTIGLNGVRRGYNVNLDWAVNTVCHIETYTIEQSNNDEPFVALTEVEETNHEDFFYTKSVSVPLPREVGTTVYRVKVQVKDQTPFYSNPVSFNTFERQNRLMLYPNPANDYVQIESVEGLYQSGTIIIYDNLGKQRLIKAFNGKLNLKLDDLTDGVYFVNVLLEGQRPLTRRLIINKVR